MSTSNEASDRTDDASTSSRDRWLVAALETIGSDGIAAVRVERLAERLGLTKGSFYWHFDGRDDVVVQAVELWEQRGTVDVIDRLAQLGDPRARLGELHRESYHDDRFGAIDAAVQRYTDDPLVGPIVRRATERRLAFLTDTFRELGDRVAVATARAELTLALYLGLGQMGRNEPTQRSAELQRQLARVLDQLVTTAETEPPGSR